MLNYPALRLAQDLIQRVCGKDTGDPGFQLVGRGGVHCVERSLGQLAELERQQLHQRLRTTPSLTFRTTPSLTFGPTPSLTFGPTPSLTFGPTPSLTFGPTPSLAFGPTPSLTFGPTPSLAFGTKHLCGGHVGLLCLRTQCGDQFVQLVGRRFTNQLNVSQQRDELLHTAGPVQDRA